VRAWNTLGVVALSKPVEQAADELYELPPAEFTRARDERAKALRNQGQRAEADAVKALRKPTLAAWALNQLARRRAKELERLLAAGDALRAAQEELLAGGDRKAFQSAAAQEREQVATLAGEAAELASEAGERSGPALTEKIAATLHAAALDEETAAELRAGRLVREREAIGGFGAMTAAPAPGRGAPSDPAPAAKSRTSRARTGSSRRAPATRGKRRKGSAAEAEPREKADRRAESERRAEAERREEAERRQRLAGARTDERHARRELEAATRATEQAETRAEAARAHAEDANRRAKTTADRLKDARRQQADAQKAHARAERALKAAERSS
jgi:hypothetical protein